MKSILFSLRDFLLKGSKKEINNWVKSLLFGFILSNIVFILTEHDNEWVKSGGLWGSNPGTQLVGLREIFHYNYLPAISTFVISSGFLFLFYNRKD